MQVTKQQAAEMINRYVEQQGLSKEDSFDPETQTWSWMKGSATIDVFIQELNFGDHKRSYLRIFSPIAEVPASGKEKFYKTLLEMNDTKLGLKLTIMPGTDDVYASFERDLSGLDFNELSTCIADLEWWADMLDDELAEKFGGEKPGVN